MGWMLGYIGPDRREELRHVHDTPLYGIENARCYLQVGGLPETCHSGTLPTGGTWYIVGLGIERSDSRCRFLDNTEWQALLSPPRPDLTHLDGHFIAVRYHSERIEIFTDQLGTRTLFIARQPQRIIFSNRLDWLATVLGGVSIDFRVFGSHWLTFNQLSTESVVADMVRLGPGGYAIIENGNLQISSSAWTPGTVEMDTDGSTFARTLSALCHPENERIPSLGLSGGLDSRLLLSLQPNHPVHVFGPSDHPDVQTAHHIAQQEEITLHHFHEDIPSLQDCLTLLTVRAATTTVISVASSVVGLRYYDALHHNNRIILDGGMGEAARRQFMNRLLRLGRSALRSGDPAAILPFLRVPRPHMFSADVMECMIQGAIEQIDAGLCALLHNSHISTENALDLFGIRTRLPNFFGLEQNRLDSMGICYMPFAQPSLLQAVFNVPLHLRSNGKLFRHLIRTHWSALARYPLVKSGITYPFGLSGLPVHILTRIKKSVGWRWTGHNAERENFLHIMRPFVLDIAHSRDVQTFSAYHPPRIIQLVTDYYKGQYAHAAAVDWWLAFEMWRRTLKG